MSLPAAFVSALSDRYRVDREIGRGGMATVYLAFDLKHGRRVALKVMHPELAAVIGRERFLREIGIAARLTHPHILPLHDSGAVADRLYYVTPYIEGESLRARLDREYQLPCEDAVRLTREIASALSHAHGQGFVHRDLKPENILLADGLALLADFGIARVMEAPASDDTSETASGPLTATGLIVGTPRYMAPEQAGGEEVDARSDIYALGCVLYEMLAGRPPFVSPTAEGLIRQHILVEARPVTELRPSVPAGVAGAIARALAKTPADRHATAARFAEALALAGGSTPSPDSPGLPPAGVPPNNLPKQRTHFIGREKELAECARILATERLLTLTGTGGCGKTRLAVRLADDVLDGFPEGAWFVDLAPLKDPGHVALTAATVLGIRETAGTPLEETLAAHLATRRLLIVLDNCEHVIEAAARLVDGLLSLVPGLKIIATSREGLGVEGERPFALKSLSLPAAATTDVAAIESAEAVRLFVDRARIVDSGFGLTGKTAPVVAEICRRLDGIPLAIELAAARVKIMSPEAIRSKLDDMFRLLTGGSRTALPRHQTLRATIGWSYDQLLEEEARFLRLLSVFAGGWTLDLAARVGASEDADEFLVMDLLARLVDKSLVVVDRTPDGETRYSLLETVRQFAMERLNEAGEAGAARKVHLDEMLLLAEAAHADRMLGEEKWGRVLESEHDNLRSALEYARNLDPGLFLKLAGALGWFWHARSHLLEGCDYLKSALATTPDAQSADRARALFGLARILAWQESDRAIPLMEEGVGIWRRLGDMREVAIALEGVAYAQWLNGDDEAARETFRECLRLLQEQGEPVWIHRANVGLAQVLVSLEECEEACVLSAEILAFATAHNDRRSEHSGLHYLADCALIRGQYEESLRLYKRSLELAHALGDRVETCFEVEGVAMSLSGLGRHAGALILAGAARAEFDRLGAVFNVRFWNRLIDRHIGAARKALGPDEAEKVWSAGREVGFEEAVRKGLNA